jgi:hypothetical protein
VVDRGEPAASCSEWHGDGTAGEDDHGFGLAVTVPARAMGEARPRSPTSLVGKRSEGPRQPANAINHGSGLAFPLPERPARVATMNALVRTVLLVIIAFLMLVNLTLLAGENTGPIEKIVLALPALLLVWAAFRLRRRAG